MSHATRQVKAVATHQPTPVQYTSGWWDSGYHVEKDSKENETGYKDNSRQPYKWKGIRGQECNVKVMGRVEQDAAIPEPRGVPLCSLAELKLRFLCPSDLPEVKALCREWFPIQYPDMWYEDITTNPRLYALAATFNMQIIGLLVAETKPLSKMNKEVSDYLLHVLTTNQQAIAFYQRHNFVRHTFLPYYYNIKGKPKDAFSYVRYVNGGHPPWTLLDYLQHWTQALTAHEVCWWPVRLLSKFWGLIARSATAVMAHRLS
ncbi:N-alpha-acetyltransferase 60-like [Portunus trituberculatus]|uniref:N-alpha-acetyltransferase 60-like n=1 Tax=Portunus trituberculatus TaxID=210409 RepID=UPI001E1CE8DD|nr:N-alpha-acetyltransferase 60-like [Portunus trituberculatus]